jgi:hypothetical protein
MDIQFISALFGPDYADGIPTWPFLLVAGFLCYVLINGLDLILRVTAALINFFSGPSTLAKTIQDTPTPRGYTYKPRK